MPDRDRDPIHPPGVFHSTKPRAHQGPREEKFLRWTFLPAAGHRRGVEVDEWSRLGEATHQRDWVINKIGRYNWLRSRCAGTSSLLQLRCSPGVSHARQPQAAIRSRHEEGTQAARALPPRQRALVRQVPVRREPRRLFLVFPSMQLRHFFSPLFLAPRDRWVMPRAFFELARTQSGTFKAGDLLVNKDGLRIVRQNGEPVQPLIKPSDNRLALVDMDMIQVIGKGTSGIVQLVRHKWTEQFFALKAIQLNNILEETRRQIAQELKINYSINCSSQCPYIVAYYQSFYDNGVISIVLEYMDGGSLADFLKKVKSIPEPYLAAICKQVLMGLVYLHHEKHIVHRDLKPANLLINHRGEVKITDFGVSATLESSSGRETFVGTCNYMSPERIIGGRHGPLSDIWSLGLVLLECATGLFPYAPTDGQGAFNSVFELLEAIVLHPPPCAQSDMFSEEFCSFISACVQKEPKDRKSAQELLEHPFLTMYEGENVDIASYFTKAGPSLASFSSMLG